MIKVKAALQRPVDSGPTRANFVESGVEKAPAGMATIGMLLVSVALYFKGIVAPYGATRPGEDEAPRRPEDDEQVAQRLEAEETRGAHEDATGEAEQPSDVVSLDAKRMQRRSSAYFTSDFAAGPIDVETVAAPALKSMSNLPARGDVDLLDAGRQLQPRDPAGSLGGSGGGGGGGGGGSGGGGGESSVPRPPHIDHARNRAPIVAGPVTLRSVAAGETIFIAFAALLAGAVDPDRDVLRVVDLQASAGELVATDGGWLYTAPDDTMGPVSFTYKISDGSESVAQTARTQVTEPLPIIGTEGDDSLVGTPLNDRIDGLGGNDTIRALSGDDIIQGGSGHDSILGLAGADTIFGGAGNDTIDAGDGDDIVWAGEGDDVVRGGAGADMVFGEAGHDDLDGGTGDDIVDGGDGNDTLRGMAGDDVLLGAAGADSIAGGDGADFLDGGLGADTIDGGAGADVVEATMDRADDQMDGGQGHDTLDLGAATLAMIIDLVEGTVSGEEIGTDTICNFESVKAGQGDDYFKVGDAPMVLTGGEGSDTFEFRAPPAPVPEPVSTASPSSDPVVDGTPGPTAPVMATTAPAQPVNEVAPLVHQIMDFAVGDKIRVGQFIIERERNKITGEMDDGDQEVRFELKPVERGATLDSDSPFRLRIERENGEEKTVIDVIVDGVDDPDYSIALSGLQQLTYTLAHS